MGTILSLNFLAASTASARTTISSGPAPQLDCVMLFGFLSAFFAVVFALHRHKSRAAKVIFAITLGALSVYGFLAGAWPLGMVMLFAATAQLFKPWSKRLAAYSIGPRPEEMGKPLPRSVSAERLQRLFSNHSYKGVRQPYTNWNDNNDPGEDNDASAIRN